jgi:hypothetical protein
MVVRRRVDTVSVAVGASILVALLSGCAPQSVAGEPTPSAPPAAREEPEPPEEGWCAEFVRTAALWSGAAIEIDEARFDAVLGVDFIGPADCYVEVVSETSVTKSVMAVFVGDDTAVAEFMTASLPDAGWEGAVADPHKGGVFTHPVMGDLGYHFAESAKSRNIPIDGPAIVVTALLAG